MRIHIPRVSWSWLFVPLLLAVLIAVLAYPMALLFIKSFALTRPGQPTVWGLEGWIGAFSDRGLSIALFNTFSLAAVRIVITTVIAIFFAWVVTRTDTPFKGFIEIALWLGFFLPMLPMTMGWILLLDPHHGLLNKFLMQIFNLSKAPFNIFSYWGIVWSHLAYSSSIRFLLITPAFRTMDAALEEAARTSGSSNFATLCRITIPILAPALLASTFLGLIKSLESLEIELVLGIPSGIYVLSTKIYDYINWEPPLHGQATALCSIFLVMVFVLIWIQRYFVRNRQYTTITGRGYVVRPTRLGPWRWVTCGLSMFFISIMIFLPLGALLMGTFMEIFGNFDLENPWTSRHWMAVLTDPLFLRSLKTTLVLGIGSGIIGTVIYALISYYIIRTRFAGRGFINLLTWLPWAMPGILISLALLWAVLGSGDFVKVIYGTTIVLILAIIIKEMPLGVQMIKAGVQQISNELEEASMAAGASWISTFRRIVIPLIKPTLIAVGIVVFIAAVRDIPTVVFLSTYHSRTISLLMLDYLAEASLESAAVVGVFIVLLIFLLLIIGRFLGLRWLSVKS